MSLMKAITKRRKLSRPQLLTSRHQLTTTNNQPARTTSSSLPRRSTTPMSLNLSPQPNKNRTTITMTTLFPRPSLTHSRSRLLPPLPVITSTPMNTLKRKLLTP